MITLVTRQILPAGFALIFFLCQLARKKEAVDETDLGVWHLSDEEIIGNYP
jgi:hypothetical protein